MIHKNFDGKQRDENVKSTSILHKISTQHLKFQTGFDKTSISTNNFCQPHTFEGSFVLISIQYVYIFMGFLCA